MSNLAIHVEGLGKKYHIGSTQQARYNTLRDTIVDTATAPFRRAKQLLSGEAYGAADLTETIWALKDITFDVNHGEVLGIIGRNGAGKSTLLKVLSRITRPTEGEADLYGRVGSMLEVGTGFHPELTGRENIYLNGTILGMTRKEIDHKLDEIVDFSGIEQFIDTPVKHYSSGMGLRLGFAVAAHLEPEILVVDEVLAVGDAEFQKKCLGKMGDVAGEGRTVLFVSHNMSTIASLCDRVIWLDKGKICQDDDTEKVIASYLREGAQADQAELRWAEGMSNQGVEAFKFYRVSLLTDEGDLSTNFDIRKPVLLQIEYEIREPLPYCRIGFNLLNSIGIQVFESYDAHNVAFSGERNPGHFVIECQIPANLLAPGTYYITLNAGIRSQRNLYRQENALSFSIENTSTVNSSMGRENRGGVIWPSLQWKMKDEETDDGVY